MSWPCNDQSGFLMVMRTWLRGHASIWWVISSSMHLGIGGIGGHFNACSRCMAIGSVPGGHSNVPWRTCSKATVHTLFSVNDSTNGVWRKCLWLACVNLHPASTKHIYSSSAFVWDLCCLVILSECGPQTWFSPCHTPPLPVTAEIWWALFWTHLLLLIHVQSDFLVLLLACAWAAISSARQRLHRLLSFFKVVYFYRLVVCELRLVLPSSPDVLGDVLNCLS